MAMAQEHNKGMYMYAYHFHRHLVLSGEQLPQTLVVVVCFSTSVGISGDTMRHYPWHNVYLLVMIVTGVLS
jgi:hypothetical protein